MAENDGTQPGADKPQETAEERDARLAEAYRAQLGGEPTTNENDESLEGGSKPQRPDHIPEKFWDAEKGEVRVDEMAKSYIELEKAKAKAPAEEDTRTPEEKAADEAAQTKATEEWTSYRAGITEKLSKGEALTDEDYAPAAAKGLSKEDVDTFVAGLNAIGELHSIKVFQEAGGEDAYKAMIEWAKTAYSPEEIAVYDRDVKMVGNPAVAMNAVRGLTARYQLANGRPAARDATKNGSSRGAEGYKSGAEMRDDMRDPKYAKDPAFRAQVAEKVKAARAAGVDLSQ